jgi:phosphatidylglycerophosphatase A
LRALILFLATGAGSGYVPVAPGTAGALVGLIVYVAGLGSLPGPLYLLTLLAAIALAVWCSESAIVIFGARDPKQVTIDEVVGMLTTFALLPGPAAGGSFPRPAMMLLGFVFFRVFDILKPFPLRWIERTAPGGYAVVLDDVAAGLYANVCLRIVARFLVSP